MRTLAKWLVLGAFGVLVAVAVGSAARAEDDIAIFNVPIQMVAGNVILEPGVYEFRATRGLGNQMLITVTGMGQVKSRALLLASTREPLPADRKDSADFLILQGKGQGQVERWEVANTSLAYVFPVARVSVDYQFKAELKTPETRTVVASLKNSR